MENFQIAEALSLLGKLSDIHGENSFKSKSYASAAFALEKITTPLATLTEDKIAAIRGIGPSTAKKILEMLLTGKIVALEELITKTPEGVLEMLQIKGIGPKKINTIWKEMEIESIGELLYACKENRLKLYKGFGEKTQLNVIEAIEFYQKHQHHFLYAQAAPLVPEVERLLRTILPEVPLLITGEFYRQMETVTQLDFIVVASVNDVMQYLSKYPQMNYDHMADEVFISTTAGLKVHLICCHAEQAVEQQIKWSSSPDFFDALLNHGVINDITILNEADFFISRNLPMIPAYMREEPQSISLVSKQGLPAVIQTSDIKGIIHCHSNWSDGSHSVEEMAEAARSRGLEYMVLSDHSQTAFYAQGLTPERVSAQHQLIDALNERYTDFRIFKSIESDILNDGHLDYTPEILSTFDLVIASIHSNLKMNEDKAMMRLMKAIENPYTSILGHLTGRLLLSRKGYPVDHDKIIDACAANQVVIELNAHPSRLDIDWRYIKKALDKQVLISINPDAHITDGFDDIRYGVTVAQKAGVCAHENLSSFNLTDITAFVAEQKRKR